MFNNDFDNQTLAQRLRAIRKAFGYSQQQMADKVGISSTLVSKLEKGERKLTDNVLSAYCLSAGASAKFIMDGEGEMFANAVPMEIINQLAKRYGLCEADKTFLITYLELDESAKKICVDFLSKFVNNYLKQRL